MAKKRKAKPGAGRKWFDGRDEQSVIAKCEVCWVVDSPDVEAASFAEIAPSTLSRYLDAHPAIAQRKAALKGRPMLLARRAMVGAFDGHEIHTRKGKKVTVTHAPINADLALRYAERKRKFELPLKLPMNAKCKDPHNPTGKAGGSAPAGCA